jgi:hypothetical protein
MKFNRTLVAVSIINLAAFASQADDAFTPAAGAPASVFGGGANVQQNLGLIFTPTVDISVDSLGFYAAPGVTTAETVTIFNSTGGVVAQTSVGLSDLANSYYWQSIAPVVLTAGQTYTIDDFVGANPWAYGGGLTTDPLITYLGSSYKEFPVVAFPSNLGGVAGGFFGPNFDPDVVDRNVPDGGTTALLLGMSFAGLGCIRRKLS